MRSGQLFKIHPYPEDAHPTPIGQSLIDAQDPDTRVAEPMVRAGYLAKREASDGRARGREPFVPVPWDEALDLAASALDRVRERHGNEAIYGGSYGWSSAGRFHHAQSQVHRFLNCIGGYTYRVDTYSAAAAEVITPHVLGMSFFDLMMQAPTIDDMVEHTRLVVCFGGIAMKNTQVMAGGLGAHTAQDQLQRLREANIDFYNVSPIRDDMIAALSANWWPIRPNADVALMLGLAHTLLVEDRHDRAFLEKYCVGFDSFRAYLLGTSDGLVKDAAWASALTEIPAQDIRALARRMSQERTVIGISWSLQRAEHGEQTYWMATVLGAMLGYHGLPGGGVAYGYGSVHNIGFGGRRLPRFKIGALPQGQNPVTRFIPVARIADMLLNPGATFDYNGRELTYPDIKLVYWAGGNPFHHHQDLNRLRRAWSRPKTIIINEPFWTAAARHADIVFPCTTPLERNDLGISSLDTYLSPMRQAVQPYAQSRNDYDVFSALADRLGATDQFTEGRSEREWIEHLYAFTRKSAAEHDVDLPDFETFWAGEQFSVENQIAEREFALEQFRRNPSTSGLRTPSGRIEIASETIASYGYSDCLGHPAWFDKNEWLGSDTAKTFPLHLLSNQPKTRLHSQYDHGRTSREAKREGREIVRMNPSDAAARDIDDGDVVRIYNQRGACLAAVVLSDGIRPLVVELPTGAWYDPEDPASENPLDVHGNPNVLTRDVGTSRLAQGPTAHSCLVEVERYHGNPPPIRAFQQPTTQQR